MRLNRALICSLCLLPAVLVDAQDVSSGTPAQEAPRNEVGVLTGKVVDSTTGQGIARVTVTVAETGQAGVTDISGNYRLEGVPAGQNRLTFYKSGYTYAAVPDAQVQPGDVNRLDFSLEPRPVEDEATGDVVLLDAIEVTAEMTQDSQIGLQSLRAKSPTVSDAIGAETFALQGLGDAAEAMGRMPAASVLEGKYVLIRGLGDRYSNTLMNGASVPSADPDRRAVQMDQFPTDMLESIQTSKTFTPDQPGAFSGGSVNIRTKSFPDQFFATASISSSYNTQTTGDDVLVSQQGVDFWGRDANSRHAPETPVDLPSSPASAINSARATTNPSLGPAQTLEAFSKGFEYGFFPETKSAPMNYSFSTAVGDQYKLGDESRLGYTLSFTHDDKYSYFDDAYLASYLYNESGLRLIYSPDETDYSYSSLLDDQQFPWGETPWGYTRSVHSVSWGAFGKLSYQPSANHEFSLDIFHNQYAEDEVRRGIGGQPEDYPLYIFESYALLYTERGISNFQLTGKDLFPGLHDAEVDWRASYSRSTQDQPDFRVMQSLYDPLYDTYSTNTPFSPSRFFRDLEEKTKEGAVDVSLPFAFFNGKSSTVKFGGLYSTTDRSYDEDQYTVYYGRSTAITSRDRLEQMYDEGSVGILDAVERPNGGWDVSLGWTTVPTPTFVSNYDGTQDITAGYAMGDIIATDHWRIIGGARVEQTQLEVTTYSNEGESQSEADLDQTDVLPALSFVYTIRDGMNIRAAYGRTLARPMLKELTSSRIYDPFLREYYQGDPNLEVTMIDNFDLRWEWFMDQGQMVAVSLFHKELDDPIEVLLKEGSQTQSGLQITSPINSDSAKLDGLEFEWRYNLEKLYSPLAGLSMGGNFAYVDSSVTTATGEERELVGQSDMILNADLTYQNFDSGTSVSITYNYVGERLYAVTLGELDNIYEHPQPTFNITVSQKLWSTLKLKLWADNILDPDFKRTLGKDGADTLRYSTGRTFGIGLSYTFL